MARKPINFRTILSVVTIFLVIYVIYKNWPDILETLNHLHETNGLILLLLIPEQLCMYYSLGQIVFSYLRSRRGIKPTSEKEVLRISTELNFVNHAIPAGGLGGLAFLTYRLRPFDVTAGQASFIYLFRYAITTVVNYLQALVAMLILVVLNLVPSGAEWVIVVAILMNLGVFIALALVVFIAGNEKRIEFASRTITKIVNKIMRFLTFGRRKRFLNYDKIGHYLEDIRESIIIAKQDKKSLGGPISWGIMYSFLEVLTYYIVAVALGRPELIGAIMVGEAIGSVFDGIVPYGLYELGMAGVMIVLGVDLPTATIITVMTRVITLLITILSGAWPYYKTVRGERNGE